MFLLSAFAVAFCFSAQKVQYRFNFGRVVVVVLIEKKVSADPWIYPCMEINKAVMVLDDSCCNVSATFELVKDKYLGNFHGKPIANLKLEIFIF